MSSTTNQVQTVIGRLVERPYQFGDALPAVGSMCLVSGSHSDVQSDQHRSYMWRKVIGYSDDRQFICLQCIDCWPTVERTTNCWFAQIPEQHITELESERAIKAQLLFELRHADEIITVLLNLVPSDRKAEMAAPLAQIYDGEGDLRYYERWKAIDAALGGEQ